MDILVLTHKGSQAYPTWGLWSNLYYFEAPTMFGRNAWQQWTDALLDWEAGFHHEHVSFIGASVIPLFAGSGGSADSLPNVYDHQGERPNGLRVSRGTPHYMYGLHVPFGARMSRPGGLLYHGCLDETDLRELFRGSVGLATVEEFYTSVVERAEAMTASHFKYLRTTSGGGGQQGAGVHLPVEMFRWPYVSLLHATTRARFRNSSALLDSYGRVWPPCIEAAASLGPLHAYFTDIAVDVIPTDIVDRGVAAGGGLYLLHQVLQQLAGATGEGEQEQDGQEPRYGTTRDNITDIAGKLEEWYETTWQPMLASIQTYEYAGDTWYKDQQASDVYDALGKGLAIAAPVMYADWIGMKEHKDGRAGSDPLPDVVELSM